MGLESGRQIISWLIMLVSSCSRNSQSEKAHVNVVLKPQNQAVNARLEKSCLESLLVIGHVVSHSLLQGLTQQGILPKDSAFSDFSPLLKLDIKTRKSLSCPLLTLQVLADGFALLQQKVDKTRRRTPETPCVAWKITSVQPFVSTFYVKKQAVLVGCRDCSFVWRGPSLSFSPLGPAVCASCVLSGSDREGPQASLDEDMLRAALNNP